VPIRTQLEENPGVFNPKELADIATVFEAALKDLGLIDRKDPATLMLAKLTIELAKQGKFNAASLRARVLKEMKPAGSSQSVVNDRSRYGEGVMPITPLLDDTKFDPETKRVMRVAFEMAWIALEVTDKDDLKSIVGKRIIELVKAGERNPDILCEKALKGLRSRRTSKQFQSTTAARKIG
jgi:hypothetical protein